MITARAPFCLIVILATISTAISAHADLPGAKDPNAYTQHTYMRETLEFNKQTMAEAYKKVGKRDPRWDDAALAFLDALARNFTYGQSGSIYKPKDYPSTEACAALAKTAIDRGCDDPLVFYFNARLMEILGRETDKLPALFQRAYADLRDSKYPAFRVFPAVTRAIAHAPPDQRETLAAASTEAMLKAAAGPFVNGAHRRTVCLFILREFEGASLTDAAEFYGRLQGAKEADPWIVNVFGGDCLVRAAWGARGGGFANTVPEDAWRAFFRHLADAEKCLTAAWKLHPDHPEAPTLMITVAMGGGERVAGTEREWFERAVTAQLDYDNAYSRLLNALLPRWGGSYEAMLELGLECARTDRYDTNVPYQLVTAIEQIRLDARDPALWKVPEAYDAATRVLDTYADTYKDHPAGPWFTSFHAAIALRLGKYDESRKLLDQLGDKVDPKPFAHFNGSRFSVPEVYARAGPHAAEVANALGLAGDGKVREALDLFRATDAKTDDADKANAYFKERITALDRHIRFEAGEWVDLLPADHLLAGLTPTFGRWSRDAQKRLVGTSDRGAGLAIYCDLDTGPRYELSLTLAHPENPADRLAQPAVIFNYDHTHANNSDNLTLVLDHANGRADLRAYTQRFRSVNGAIPNPATVLIQSYDGRSQITIDGLPQPLRHERPKQAGPLRASLTGVGSAGAASHGILYVTAWKIRKLDKSPFAN